MSASTHQRLVVAVCGINPASVRLFTYVWALGSNVPCE
jgi:hypothetical protein